MRLPWGGYPHGGWTYRNQPTYFAPAQGDFSGDNLLALVGMPGDGNALPQFAGWGFQVLPFVEQQTVFKSGAQSSISSQTNIFFCPSRGRSQDQRSFFANNFTVDNAAEGQLKIPGVQLSTPGDFLQIAATDYASAYAGKYLAGRGLNMKNPQGPDPETSGIIVRARLVPGTPYPRQVAGVTASGVPDGTSNTILLGEKLMNLTFLGQPQLDDDQGYTAGWDIDVNRSTSFAPEGDYGGTAASFEEFNSGDISTANLRVERLFKFGSSHPGIVNCLFADGSAHAIKVTISPRVFEALGGRADGIVISYDDF
jgi:prepilin-type processing-associated H-X9-DG protein